MILLGKNLGMRVISAVLEDSELFHPELVGVSYLAGIEA
jgi:hypothetical protein